MSKTIVFAKILLQEITFSSIYIDFPTMDKVRAFANILSLLSSIILNDSYMDRVQNFLRSHFTIEKFLLFLSLVVYCSCMDMAMARANISSSVESSSTLGDSSCRDMAIAIFSISSSSSSTGGGSCKKST